MSETRTPQEEPARDVLAAEAFAMPGADPRLHPRPVVLPGDPTGIEEPHDILAAEDFAMPAPPQPVLARRNESSTRIAIGAVVAALLALVVARRRRRR